jgi:hypothetical protein
LEFSEYFHALKHFLGNVFALKIEFRKKNLSFPLGQAHPGKSAFAPPTLSAARFRLDP